MQVPPELELHLKTARTLLDLGYPLLTVLENPLIPHEHRSWVAAKLEEESNRTFERARVISASPLEDDWLSRIDRSSWYYWPELRRYLLGMKNRPIDQVRSLDDTSEKVLRQLGNPHGDDFDIRGLVLGHVQSGKTANFTAVIAKAVDAGYRLVVVFSGTDNGLRMQTQRRLNRELTGYPKNEVKDAVPHPPVGKQWLQFTTDDLKGDFQPGKASTSSLQGSQPVLLVVKKNGDVLRRLRSWLEKAPEKDRSRLPVLFIDDEADQASIDTRGSHQTEDDADIADPDYTPPAVINGLIRELLGLFTRRAYVAYTATPFANILVPHNNYDPLVGPDLYPKDFFIDIPKPAGYFGTEEFFGINGDEYVETGAGLDVIRHVDLAEVASLELANPVTKSLETAVLAFILGGAARACRGQSLAPSTMLIHTSHKIQNQKPVMKLVEALLVDLRNEWRYDRRMLRGRLELLWKDDFLPTSFGVPKAPTHSFSEIEPFIGPFLDAIVVREVNSDKGDVLDYDKEPHLKAIAVGGNRLSRGLTLEGLLVSFFGRHSPQYDTLLQMARWFGFRGGYEDLTRIYTTELLSTWFIHLSLVEARLRQDLRIYESQPSLSPLDVGMRVLTHPSMKVTSDLKNRFGTVMVENTSFSETLLQTINFPLHESEALLRQCNNNWTALISLLDRLGNGYIEKYGPLWNDVPIEKVLDFLDDFIDLSIGNLPFDQIRNWIRNRYNDGHLLSWTVAVRGRESCNPLLGSAGWVPDGLAPVWNLERTRLKASSTSLGVITSDGDEALGLSKEEKAIMTATLVSGQETNRNRAARLARDPKKALLLIYPISKYSGHEVTPRRDRQPLYPDPEGPFARDLIGLALSFPKTGGPRKSEKHMTGTVPWRPA